MFIDFFNIKSASDAKVSFLKTISWRIIGTLDTMIIAYLFTGELKIAVSIGGLEVITKMFLYYAHERAWIKLLKSKK